MKSLNPFLLLALAIATPRFASECNAQDTSIESTTEVVLASEVKWQPLNPKRGKDGPQAGTLWGDQTKKGASGFLVKFVDGFSSPPHIHNITYRGVVIDGSLYNGPAEVEPTWMPPGSYWTQPVGQPHITAARGVSVAYIEIHDGPYLVMPTEKAFDRGERPINVDASNIVWLDASNTTWIKQAAETAHDKAAKVAFLWGKPQQRQLSGSLVKLPAGFTGTLHMHGASFRAVVIKGEVGFQAQQKGESKNLEPGSYIGGTGKSIHRISSNESGGSIIYIHINGTYQLLSE